MPMSWIGRASAGPARVLRRRATRPSTTACRCVEAELQSPAEHGPQGDASRQGRARRRHRACPRGARGLLRCRAEAWRWALKRRTALPSLRPAAPRARAGCPSARSPLAHEAIERLLLAGLFEVAAELVAFDLFDAAVAELQVEYPFTNF